MPVPINTPAMLDLLTWDRQFGTAVYIGEKPTTIILIPTRDPNQMQEIAKPGGGHDYVQNDPITPRMAQTFRLIAKPNNQEVSYSSHDDNIARKFEYTLIGASDAVVEIGDTWSEGANQYRVDSIEPYNGFEVRANVTVFAVDPTHG